VAFTFRSINVDTYMYTKTIFKTNQHNHLNNNNYNF
jgi:hypothetical protein